MLTLIFIIHILFVLIFLTWNFTLYFSSLSFLGKNAIESSNAQKVGRGRTIGLSVAKKKKKSATGKLHVVIPTDKMVAVGSGAANFVTEISTVVLKNAPFDVKKWRKIPKETENKIVAKVLVNRNLVPFYFIWLLLQSTHYSFHFNCWVQDTFDIDNTKHNRDVIIDTAKRLYRNHRCRFHKHFSQYKTNEIALEHKPDDLSDEDWKYLVDYFSSLEFKVCLY